MSDDPDFLTRWSRRKRDATDKTEQSKPEDPPGTIASEASVAFTPASENRRLFDPAALPTIESIGAGSDIRAFLEAGVPAELKRAALRRVWSVDLGIRDFVGLSENSWDFNAPGEMPGFGPIGAEEVTRLLTRLLGASDVGADEVDRSLISPSKGDGERQADDSDLVEERETGAELVSTRAVQSDVYKSHAIEDGVQHGRAFASQHKSIPIEPISPLNQRGHGTALPQLREPERVHLETPDLLLKKNN